MLGRVKKKHKNMLQQTKANWNLKRQRQQGHELKTGATY